MHAVSNTWVHGGTPRHDIVGIQVLPDVNVALHDAVVGGLMDPCGFHTWVPGRGDKQAQVKCKARALWEDSGERGELVGGEREGGTHTNEGRLEEGFWAAETFVADGDDLPIRQLIALFEGGGRGSSGHLVLKVQRHIAQLLLDVTDDLTFSCEGEAKPSVIAKEEQGMLASPP